MKVWGKGNNYYQVPLNATARKALQVYAATVSWDDDQYLFISQRTKTYPTPRGLEFLVSKYAGKAGFNACDPTISGTGLAVERQRKCRCTAWPRLWAVPR